jgi:hypothetical protein
VNLKNLLNERAENLPFEFPLSPDELRAALVAFPEYRIQIEEAQRMTTENRPPDVMLFYAAERSGVTFIPCVAALLNFHEVITERAQPDLLTMVAGDISFATAEDATQYAERHVERFLVMSCQMRAAQKREAAGGDSSLAIPVTAGADRLTNLEEYGSTASGLIRDNWRARIKAIEADARAREEAAQAWRN